MKTSLFISIKISLLVLSLIGNSSLYCQQDISHVAPPPANSGYVPVNGMKMYYEVQGKEKSGGLPIIVLHGAYMNIPSMGDIIPALAKSHQVYAIEMQGHGRTNDIDRPITYQNLADDVAAFMHEMKIEKADIVGYSMGAIAGMQLAFRHAGMVNKLISISGGYDLTGWQPEYQAIIPFMTVDMFVNMPFAEEFKRLSPDPDGFRDVVKKLIQLEKEPMAWENEVQSMKTPVLIISGDADVGTLEHYVKMFRLLGGGVMGDMGKPLPASRLAILPASSHTSMITQTDVLLGFIEPFLKGEVPKGFFQN